MKVLNVCFAGLLMVLTMVPVSAQVPMPAQNPLIFANQQQQDRFDKLTQEVRCLVCQNQNLADSDAPLAHDLRREIHAMLQTGKSNDQIKQFLLERYGDFVLYRPPVQKNTALLWFAPLLLLLGGALVLRSSVKKRSALLNEGENNKDPSEKGTNE